MKKSGTTWHCPVQPAKGAGLSGRGERRAAASLTRGIDVNGTQRPWARGLAVEGAAVGVDGWWEGGKIRFPPGFVCF